MTKQRFFGLMTVAVLTLRAAVGQARARFCLLNKRGGRKEKSKFFMNARRLTLACILFILSVAMIFPWSQQAQSSQGPGGAANSPSAATSSGGEPTQDVAVAGTVLRTLVYHEITSLNQHPRGVPILSKNGNRAAFVLQTGPGEFRIFVINADGTGQREVDSYTNLGGVPPVDINADGSKVLSRGGGQIRLVNADGTNPHEVIRISDGFIQIRLSADGTKVFFTVDRDFSVGSENLTKGLYVINGDGSGRRQIVSGANIATLLSAPPGGLNFVSTSGTSLDVSADASRIIFGTSVDGKGQYILGVNFDGSGLHQILGPANGFNHAAISGDGLKVAYDIALPCCSPNEAGVINFDGTQKKPLVTDASPFNHSLYPIINDPMQLSADGSRLLFGAGVLFNTATGEALQLAAKGGFFSNDPPFLVNEGMIAATMNGSATRFLYLAPDLNNVLQLATLDLNPGSLGAAPSVTEPKLDPTFVITHPDETRRSKSTLSARVSATNTLVRVNNAVLFNGLTNANAFNGLTDSHVGRLVLLDDGTTGDTTTNDGIFTNNQLGADCCAVLGSRLVRVKAEVRASDGKRHATAIDFEPLTVTDQEPSIDVSPTSLDFGPVSIGQSKDLTLTIRNIGNIQLTVNSLTSDNPQFTVPSPAAPFTLAPGGQQTVTVRFTPNAVGPQGGRLTINSTDLARPSINVFLSGVGVTSNLRVLDHRITGGPIPDGCTPPTPKSTFAPTDALVFQWISVSGSQNGAVLKWEWIQPNGSIYETHPKAPLDNPFPDVCFNDAIAIAGKPAASLPGNWQVRFYYNGALIATDNFTITAATSCPTIAGISPTSGAVGSSVTITGTNLSGASVKFANNVAATITASTNTSLTVTVPSGAVNGPITVSKANCSDVTTNSFTVTPTTTNRTVRAVCSSGSPGGTLTVPIELVSQGDENALGFSLTFDPAVLSNPQAAKGSDASSALFNTNASQAAQGRFGIALALPSNTTFAAGTRQIAVVIFTIAANTTATTTTIGFGDAPIIRQVSNVQAQAIPANYQACTSAAITKGFEADVTPRPNGKGDGSVAITDWVEVGRFAAGLDTAAVGSEFQRADCAPKETKGDGQITITDWVQAGRYAAGLDAIQTAGGPTGPSSFANSSASVSEASMHNEAAGARVLRIVNTTFQRGQLNSLNITIDAQGDENALGFSLNFDPSVLSYTSAVAGSGTSDALLIVNTNQTGNGRLGVALALPAGQHLQAGTQTIVTVRFNVALGSTVTTPVTFGDQPIKRQVSDANANATTASFTDSTLTVNSLVTSVSAATFSAGSLASEEIASAFGFNLATGVEVGTTLPLKTSLAGTTVKVKDSAGTERLAPLFFVSPGQINYQIPPGTLTGAATVTVTNGDGGIATGTIQIDVVSPGLFTFNSGQGVPAAIVRRFRNNQELPSVLAAQQDAQGQWVPLPIDLGSDTDLIILEMFGTGLRFHSASASSVTVKIGDVDAQIFYAGLTPGLFGLDQVDFVIPRSLIGRGDVNIVLTVDGKTANTVKVNIK